MTAQIPPELLTTLRQAQTVVDKVSFDENGALVGGHYQGGNGGLLSRDTLAAVDTLRRQLEELGVTDKPGASVRRRDAL